MVRDRMRFSHLRKIRRSVSFLHSPVLSPPCPHRESTKQNPPHYLNTPQQPSIASPRPRPRPRDPNPSGLDLDPMAVDSLAREKTEALVESPLRYSPPRYSPPRAAKPDADAASEGSSGYSGDASDRRDADILVFLWILILSSLSCSNSIEFWGEFLLIDLNLQALGLSNRSEEYRLLFRLPPDEVSVCPH